MRRLARCSRTRKRPAGSPRTIAASRGESPSQAISISASRSFSGNDANAALARASPSSDETGSERDCVAARRASRPRRRRSPRRCVASTRRATPRSHGSAGSGTWPSRLQATRNVSATMSSTTASGARRRTYATTVGSWRRKRSSRRSRSARSAGSDWVITLLIASTKACVTERFKRPTHGVHILRSRRRGHPKADWLRQGGQAW